MARSGTAFTSNSMLILLKLLLSLRNDRVT